MRELDIRGADGSSPFTKFTRCLSLLWFIWCLYLRDGQIEEMLDYRGVGLWRCRIIEVLDYRGRIIEVSDYRGVRLWRCRIIEVSDYRGGGL